MTNTQPSHAVEAADIRIVELPNCITVRRGNEILGSFAGSDCREHAELFASALARPLEVAAPVEISRAEWISQAKAFYIEAGDNDATAQECARYLCNDQDWAGDEIGDPREQAQEDIQGRGRMGLAAIAASRAPVVSGAGPECESCNQLVRALREAVDAPTFMGEPVTGKRCAYCSQLMLAGRICPAREIIGPCVPVLAAQPKDPAPGPVAPKGYVLTPIVPTRAMEDAAIRELGWCPEDVAAAEKDDDERIDLRVTYSAMIHAATPPGGAGGGVRVVPDTAPMYKALMEARIALSAHVSGAGIHAIALIDKVLHAAPAAEQGGTK